MKTKYQLRVIAALLLVTWAHFLDRPPRSAIRDDPRIVSTQRQPARIFSFSLVLLLLLRLFAMAFVISLAVVLGVLLFVFVLASFCKWQMFVTFYGRTWNHSAKRGLLLLLLLLAHASRISFRLTHKTPPNQHGI